VLKDEQVLLLKPSVSYGNIKLSFPFVLVKNMAFGLFPLKLCAGLMALVGLVFYNWSEDDEFNPDDTPAKRKHRYSEDCASLNKRRSHVANEALLLREAAKDGLVVLEAWVYDSKLKKDISSELERLKKEAQAQLRADAKKLPLLVDAARDSSKVLQSEAVNVTTLVNNIVLLSSLRFDVAEYSRVNALPSIGQKGVHEIAVLYYLRGALHISHARERLVIGRNC
jgi:hypothetical protein